MALTPNLLAWLQRIDDVDFLVDGEIGKQAISNALVFDMHEARSEGVHIAQLCEFLSLAAESVGGKILASAVGGLFYSWFDELSDTLRCSFVSAGDPRQLPFSARVQVTLVAKPLAVLAVSAPENGVIPWSDFEEAAEWVDPESEEAASQALLVFVRELGVV